MEAVGRTRNVIMNLIRSGIRAGWMNYNEVSGLATNEEQTSIEVV